MLKKKKKQIVLRLIANNGSIALEEMAKKLYGKGGKLEKSKTIRLLSAYRAKDKKFENIRVRNNNIVIL